MAVRYLKIDSTIVSAQHYAWMSACRSDGVSFRINSGKRYMTQQWWLYRNQPPLAAFPSPRAPHIRTGNPNHDNDIDMYYGDGVQAVLRWLRRRGASPSLCVRGEGWHVCLPSNDLAMLYRKFKVKVLHVGSRGEDVQRLHVLLRGVKRWKGHAPYKFSYRTKRAVKGYQRSQGIRADGIYGPATRRHLEHDYDKHN